MSPNTGKSVSSINSLIAASLVGSSSYSLPEGHDQKPGRVVCEFLLQSNTLLSHLTIIPAYFLIISFIGYLLV